ncbi:NUDIX hydrolase [Pseudooceanicola sp.]|uniref:NUDIX hydrolase n=1 Tax=Pseudooceanicola sp. TaxID=1914328 RepID=UPI000C09788E|nr:NUDIX hydrolase [Pseudooceanicola sp.]|tara:strand:+ start:17365 stop:17850 length:486 start_codon:yes stop_codon:yes gene_type:complete
MYHHLRSAWQGYVLPMLQRPKRLQVAALCYRGEGDKTEVLIVSSRGTGRWIIPKGWPIRGLTSAQAALQEAWEEAGVRKGRTTGEVIGSYTYKKRKSGWAMLVDTLVYPVAVDDLRDDFPEASERRRKWVPPQKAAELVQEPELQELLRTFRPEAVNPHIT